MELNCVRAFWQFIFHYIAPHSWFTPDGYMLTFGKLSILVSVDIISCHTSKLQYFSAGGHRGFFFFLEISCSVGNHTVIQCPTFFSLVVLPSLVVWIFSIQLMTKNESEQQITWKVSRETWKWPKWLMLLFHWQEHNHITSINFLKAEKLSPAQEWKGHRLENNYLVFFIVMLWSVNSHFAWGGCSHPQQGDNLKFN